MKLKDIKGFVYGPFSTRFWMMKMGINQIIADNAIQRKKEKQPKEKQRDKNEEYFGQTLETQ